jgi:asparagine N-glycosylation enzyme membrane subunit Stt3
MDFPNGYKSQVMWTRTAEPIEQPRQGTSWFAVIAGIALLVLVALVLLIVAISKAKSGTGKVLGIIVVILLILGLLGALPLMWYVSLRVENARPAPMHQGMDPSGEIELMPEGN